MVVDIADRQVDDAVEEVVAHLAYDVLAEEGTHPRLEEACSCAGKEHCRQAVEHGHQVALALAGYDVDGIALEFGADQGEDAGKHDHSRHTDEQAYLSAEILFHTEESTADIRRFLVIEIMWLSSWGHQLSLSFPNWDS